ncbi:MAG: glutamate racemase [Bacteroidia bacterium]|nr:glutamate racemase [Bacteroidia bacterium]
MKTAGPIGVFDSGYGGLTILKEFVQLLPQYDYLYLGDNARAPYGNRSFETVYDYTKECVNFLFSNGCKLVILACNTASAKALRTIQQKDLPLMQDNLRVLGVIRPTTEIVGNYTKSQKVGIFATTGTVLSQSYVVEIQKFFPAIEVTQEACPMWVPLVENNEFNKPGADYFVKKHIDSLLSKQPDIDTIILGCTHYPLLVDKIKSYLPKSITLLAQGQLVAQSLSDYLTRHPEIEIQCSKNGTQKFLTTDDAENFNKQASIFIGASVNSTPINLPD